jgi:glycosyltransferase involved in cell wall biosynthesis
MATDGRSRIQALLSASVDITMQSAPPTIALTPAVASFCETIAPTVMMPSDAADSVGETSLPHKDTLRVLHLVNGEHFAGAERVQSHLGRCLPALGIRADFACLKPGRFADAVDAANGEWGTAYRFPMKNRFDVSILNRVCRAVKEHDYQLLHAHTPRTAMVAALASIRTGVPWVYHVHSPTARDSAKQLNNRLNAMVERLSLLNCSHLITVSDSLRRELLASGVSEDHVTVVRNGVPGVRYPRKSTPEVGGRWVFGMVALMRPRKGLEVALDAISILQRQGYDIVLRCIGPYENEDYRRRIEMQIDALHIRDRVEVTGFKSDVPKALSELDAMLLPSLYGEGLPMVVLEAMASALPVIATRVEGTPEAIRDCIDGMLAEPGSAESLASNMRDLMEGVVDWNEFAESSFIRHQVYFSDVAMSKGIAAVYRSVIK